MIEKIGHYSITNPATVYDEEALTALELAGRTAAKVNECVEEVNRIPGNITNEVQRQIDSGAFDDQIDKYAGELKDQISECVENTNVQVASATEELTQRVNQAENDLGARVDNLLGKVTEGSTTGDAELIDARTDHDSTLHANAGEALRSIGKKTRPVVYAYSGVFNWDYNGKKITVDKLDMGLAICRGEKTEMCALNLESAEIPLTSAFTLYIMNTVSKTLKTSGYTSYKYSAGDVVLFASYSNKPILIALSPDSMKINGEFLYRNITPPHRGFLFLSAPVQVDTAKNTVTMQPAYFIKPDTSVENYGYFRYGIYGSLATPLTVKCNPQGGALQYVCYDHSAKTLQVVERNHVFRKNEFCVCGFMKDMGYVPFDVHPSCFEFVDEYEGEPAVADFYQTPGDIISRIANATEPVRIVLGGDSITHGVSGTGFNQDGAFIIDNGSRSWSENPNGYCWANLFKSYIENNYNAFVTNKACTGTNSAFWNEHKSELIPTDTDIFILAIGTNDRIGNGYSSKEAALSGYFQNLCDIVEFCHNRGIAIILCSPIPATQAQEESSNYLFHCMDANAVVAKVAARYHMGYVNMYNALSYYWREHEKSIDDYFASGGLHPNDLGYKLMFYKILEGLNLAPHYVEV